MVRAYDYIIIGAGASGLSLLNTLLSSPLQNKRILIIDRSHKTENDRTWCFWEDNKGPFENLVSHKWPKAVIKGKDFNRSFDLRPFQYKMIEGKDFYSHMDKVIESSAGVHRLHADVREVSTENGEAIVKTTQGVFKAEWAFDSRFDLISFQPKKGHHLLLQHFLGWFIHTEEECFSPDEITFMDFDIPQNHGTCFMYILPFSKKRALVEYTFFTSEILDMPTYEAGLKAYLDKTPFHGKYTIERTEFGAIPMTTHPFERVRGKVVQLGTSGGMSKASTGFTFQRIQEDSQELVQLLSQGKTPSELKSNRFTFYDRILLNVLATEKVPGSDVFVNLFKKNNPVKVLEFLNEDSSFGTELGIIAKSPRLAFTKAFFQEVLKP